MFSLIRLPQGAQPGPWTPFIFSLYENKKQKMDFFLPVDTKNVLINHIKSFKKVKFNEIIKYYGKLGSRSDPLETLHKKPGPMSSKTGSDTLENRIWFRPNGKIGTRSNLPEKPDPSFFQDRIRILLNCVCRQCDSPSALLTMI